ncbi:MAG TPA: secretin and TonB N-terminal domain-containing protein [Tepidisphaeraceae bacterium]|nr:secretin and TonB N-terminal domain-containing protein [Tepidisphaeraceae bacterium]
MRKWTKAASLLFFAIGAVCPTQSLWAAEKDAKPASGKAAGAEVRLLDETAGPIASPTTKPAEGQSVSSQQVAVSDAGTVEIHVNEANLVEVLRMLSLQSQRNIVASKEVRGTVTANLYNVTIREALDAVLKANGFAYREKGNFIYVYSAKELADIEKSERQMTTEVFRLHYTPGANAVNIIKPALSTEGQVSFTIAAVTGIESDAKEAGGNTHATEDVLVVRDYPDNIEKVKKIIKEVDARPQQVLVEATIVAARLNDDNNLGIDFNILGGVDFATVLHKNGQITGAELPEGATGWENVNSVGTGNNFTKGLNSGFKVGVVTDNVSVFLNALESITDTAVLANPKVLTLNKQRGEVLVGSEDGYKTSTVTQTTTVETVEFLKTGTRLIFRPFIGEDGYVRMEIHPEDSSGGLRDGLPFKKTAELTTNVMVKDGNTIVIGGLFRESSTSTRNQVPGLGSLPVLGLLFRNQQDSTIREELIILLTPRIVKDERAYASASEEELKDIERLRVGVRQGMMPWGRERLAEGSYDKAVKEMSKPNPDTKKAIWHLNCATNLNPKFLEAIKMKESLTGRELTTVDNSSIRGFVRRQIIAERSAEQNNAPKAEANIVAEPVSAVPATQPVAVNTAAQPVTSDCAAATGVTTSNTEPTANSEPQVAVTTPTTQPVAAAPATPETPKTEPVVEDSKNDQQQAAATPAPAVPSTQPSTGDEKTENVVVTEISSEPIADETADEDEQE